MMVLTSTLCDELNLYRQGVLSNWGLSHFAHSERIPDNTGETFEIRGR